MKNKKALIIIGIMITVIILIYFLYADYWTTIKINWKISMPYMSVYRETYHKTSEPSFFGDGIRYHVFSYENEKYIEKMLNWEVTEKTTEIYSSYSEFIKTELDRIEVPEKERPKYSKCKYWYNKDLDDEIVICWDDDIKKLYVIELFI